MKTNTNWKWIAAFLLLLLFAGFTAIVAWVDVQPIGPEQSMVGLASLNQWVFQHLGGNLLWYRVTEGLGMAVLAVAGWFAATGLMQLIRRRSIRKVDRHLLLLGVLYALTAGCYVLFEKMVVNCRPVLLEDGLEASYPSSHTLLAICVLASAMIVFRRSVRRPLQNVLNTASVLIMAVTVVGRLLSGVHWLTDVVGAVLLSAGLVMLYAAAVSGADES